MFFSFLGWRGLLGSVHFGLLLFLGFEVFWGGRIAFEGAFDVAVRGLPNLVGVHVDDLHAGKHAPEFLRSLGGNGNPARAHDR
jgi:hypothetical protein